MMLKRALILDVPCEAEVFEYHVRFYDGFGHELDRDGRDGEPISTLEPVPTKRPSNDVPRRNRREPKKNTKVKWFK